MVSKYNSFIGNWVDVKKKEKDKHGKNIIWKGILESVSDHGCTLWNGLDSAGGLSETATIPWEHIEEITLQREETVDYFVG